MDHPDKPPEPRDEPSQAGANPATAHHVAAMPEPPERDEIMAEVTASTQATEQAAAQPVDVPSTSAARSADSVTLADTSSLGAPSAFSLGLSVSSASPAKKPTLRDGGLITWQVDGSDTSSVGMRDDDR